MSDTPLTDKLFEEIWVKRGWHLTEKSDKEIALEWFKKGCDESQLSEARLLLNECIPVIEAVGHIGVDFGYGEYELEPKHIENSRELLTKLTNFNKGKDSE